MTRKNAWFIQGFDRTKHIFGQTFSIDHPEYENFKGTKRGNNHVVFSALYEEERPVSNATKKIPWNDMLTLLGQGDGFENGYGFNGPNCSKVDSILIRIHH